jgi:hypothetical protein
LKTVNGPLNNSLKEEIYKRIGWWLRTEIKNLFDRLEARSDAEKSKCRYQIPVPITPDELLLFENNQTEVELALSDFLDDLVTDYIVINDIKSLSWKTGISEHQIKRKLVDMGVIETVQSEKNKRNLKGIDGARYPQPRNFKLAKSYRDNVLFKKLIHS